MSYNYSKQRRRVAPTRWLSAPNSTDSRAAAESGQSTADVERVAPDECVDRRLMTDGGEDQSEDEESEDDGADEEMQPPEQEGEAGVEEAEEENPEETEAEEAEEEEPEEAEAEEAEEEKPEEAEAEEAEEEEPEKAEAEEAEADAEAEEAEEEEGEAEEEEVVDVPQSDIESEGAESDESTTVLFLDIYGLDLDLLGLEVQLHQVVLDVFATEGDGNLLGNLLSSVAGLTDPGGLSNLIPDGISDILPEGGLSGMLPEDGLLPEDGIGSMLGFGGEQEGEEGEEGEEGDESEGFISSKVSSIRESIPSLPVKQLLIEVIAGVIKQLLESPEEDASGEEA